MAQPQQPMLIKPDQIDRLPLEDSTKVTYKNGLTNLWKQYESLPEGSQEREQVHEKIRAASTRVMSYIASRRSGAAGGGGQPRPNQPHPGNMQQQQQQQQKQAQAQAQAQAQYAQQMSGQQTGGGQQMGDQQQGNQMTPQQAQAMAQARQGGQPGGQVKLSKQAQDELDSVQLAIPPEFHQAWRQKAYLTMARRDQIYSQAKTLQMAIQQAKSTRGEVSPQMQRQFEEAQKAMSVATRNWKMLKAQGEGQQQQGQPASGAQSQQQAQQRPPTQQGVNQGQQPLDAKSSGQEQGNSLSPQQPQNGFQQQGQPSQAQQGMVAHASQQNMQQQQQPQQPQQQTPQTATQPQPPQQFPQNNMQQPPRPPQINTQQMQNQMNQQQSAGSQSAMPQSGNPQQQPPQRPQPLTHQDAVNQAAQSYKIQQQGQQPAQMPNGLPYNNQPGSASQGNTPTYPNLQTQQNSASTKFPIPKTLSLDSRTQTAVAGPPQRPTSYAAGPMYAPGIQRAPPYVLEGDGDRVLSKRKLDELVRQVTGAAPGSDSESGSVLSPEVEESILEMTDNFVDDLITSACRLAKLRPNQTLDIRDIQIVLERNYGIRVPGYSLDETRSVKKFQPAPGWQQKMQAVQAGKVMGSKDP